MALTIRRATAAARRPGRTTALALPLLALATAALAGCAAGPAGSARGAEQAATRSEVRARIAAAPGVPQAGQLTPEARLISFAYSVGGDDAMRRDTVQGRERVALWLGSLKARVDGTGTPFRMEPREILVCQGAAVERGHFPVPGRRGEFRTQEYLALWTPEQDGWRVREIRLGPAIQAAALGEGCRGERVQLSRWAVGLSVDPMGGGAREILGEAALADGYESASAVESARTGMQGWLEYTLTDRLGVRASLSTYDLATDAWVLEELYFDRRREARVQGLVATVLLDARRGPFSVGAGPAVWKGSAEVAQGFVYPNRPDSWSTDSESRALLGLAIEGTARVRLPWNLRGLAGAGYYLFQEIPESSPLPAPLDISRPVLRLGLEWVP